jgi:tetratricopeptide (TPR) repeat protein
MAAGIKAMTFSDRINKLFDRQEWTAARKLLLAERAKAPDDHWVLTQLGVTYYEQRQYKKAERLFREATEIMPECPLALWHLAGARDALGDHQSAIRIYSRLLASKRTPAQDPCWESNEWTEALKTDCVYSLGFCFRQLGKKRKAERYYREYLNLLMAGAAGMYPAEDVIREIQELRSSNGSASMRGDLRKALNTLGYKSR